MDGFKTIVDTFISPKEAFESLREKPAWALALIVLVGLMLAGTLMQRPAALHAGVGTLQHMMATNSFFSSMTDAQKAEAIEKAQHPDAMSAITGPIVGVCVLLLALLLNALILWVTSGGGSAVRFSSLWAASIYNSIASFGLAQFVLGIICLARGADSFAISSDLYKALPNLGMIAPIGGLGGNLLIALNVFTLYGLFLNMQILRWTGKVSGATVWIVPALITLVSGFIQAFFIGFAG